MMKTFAKIFLVAAFILTISSCDRQSCKNVSCPANKNCSNGRCYCVDGLEGNNCEINSYEKFETGITGGSGNKSWTVTESCYSASPNFPQYTSYILHDPINIRLVNIYNMLGGYCSVVVATIRTDPNNQGNILEIQTQSCGGITLSGQGTYDVNYHRIIFQLNYTLSTGSYQCTETYY